jgi:hypothetical protein
MQLHFTALSVLLLLVACDIRLPDGRLICRADRECPSGWSCVDQRCHSALHDAGDLGESHVDEPIDGGIDAQPAVDEPAPDAGGMSQHADEQDSGMEPPPAPSTDGPVRLDAPCDSLPGTILRACSDDGVDKLVCLEGHWKFNGRDAASRARRRVERGREACLGDRLCDARPGDVRGAAASVCWRAHAGRARDVVLEGFDQVLLVAQHAVDHVAHTDDADHAPFLDHG